LCLSARNRKRPIWKRLGSAAKTLRSLGAPDSVRCARLATVNWLLSGSDQWRTAINHRTVRWCTGLSGEPFTCEVIALGKRLTVYDYKSLDCPVSQRSAGPTVGRAIRVRRVAKPTIRRGHRTVRCAPDSVRCANGSGPSTVGCATEGKKSAPDCPVRQATEGMNCLPGMLSTAPSCLGAIKGTPRRMEENTKHSLSIPKHQDFNSAHSILCDSN
jgi:hypothetical protein